ncbi:uncharacterized protein LOC143336273 isoform X2 [Chaetodon auriga]|uniref:uncharacterized protein LOC143336273 isoform X2 n=1 Tax=Chaetodon auriga TaxID=39042 RepID=UPI004032FF99
MAEFRWIKISVFLVLVLQFTAGRDSVIVRLGDEVTLPCDSVTNDQTSCDRTTWTFRVSRREAAAGLVNASDRLSVTENCSLVITTVTVEDVGRYTCQEKKSGEKQGSDSVVHLSVINMTERKNTDMVTLNCSVWTYERCTLKVQWLYNDEDVDKHNRDIRTSQSGCSASVKFLSYHYIYKSRYKSLKCKVTNGDKEQLFDFIPQPSGEDKTTTTTESSVTKLTRTTEISTEAGTIRRTSAIQGWWWLCIVGAVVSVALLMIAVKVVRGRRTEGNKSRTNDNVADPVDGVSYASISYTKKTSSKAPVQSKKDDDEGDAVTYTSVKASSCDPSNLYATIS